MIYENEIVDSKVQPKALTTAIGTLLSCKKFSSEDYETLITRVAQYSYKLLKKPDQCRMVILCSHLFWPRFPSPEAVEGEEGETKAEPYSSPQRVLECMQKSLKIASATDPNLIVEILDRYVLIAAQEQALIVCCEDTFTTMRTTIRRSKCGS